MDARNCCLRAGYSRYLVTHSFSWCERAECPDNVRLNDVGALLDHVNDAPNFSPTCVVDIFMLRLVSCVLGHVLQMRTLLLDNELEYGMGNLTCERFLDLDWQAVFIRKFCVPVVEAPHGLADLIAFEPGVVNPPLIQRYRQAFPSSVDLFPGNEDLNLSQVLDQEVTFTLSDLQHTVQ